MADVTIFDTRMRSEFHRAFQADADQAPIDAAIMDTDSNMALERYPWLSPVPGVQEFTGKRRIVNIDPDTIYEIKNRHFDAAFALKNEDIRRDQTEGRAFATKATKLAGRFREHRRRIALEVLAAGKTGLGFDGSAFFGDDHNEGGDDSVAISDDNLMTEAGGDFTIANSTGSPRAIFLITDGDMAPLIYQREEGPNFNSNAGSEQADFDQQTSWWGDVWSNAGYGFWWNAILAEFDGQPTLAEIQTIIDSVQTRFREFVLPKAQDSDGNEYPHEQRQFSSANLIILCTTDIVENFETVMTRDRIADETNTHMNRAKVLASHKLDGI